MKKLITIIIVLFSLSASAQTNVWRTYYPIRNYRVCEGEYTMAVIHNYVYYNASAGVMVDAGLPHNIIGGAGGAHQQYALDSFGNVYGTGDNHTGALGIGNTTSQAGWVQITRDSIGNPFNKVVQIVGGGTNDWDAGALTSDGKVYVWGDLVGGACGNGTYCSATSTYPIQVVFPAGVFIVKLEFSTIGMAIDQNGHVWTWGGAISGVFFPPYLLGQGNNASPYTWAYTPVQIADLEPGVKAVDIAGGGQVELVLLANGHVYGGAYHVDQMSVNNVFTDMSYSGFKYARLDNIWNLNKTIVSIKGISTAFYLLMSDGTLYGGGTSPSGESGNGLRLNYATNTTPGPWAWSQNPDDLIQLLPTQIAVGENDFVEVGDGQALVFYSAGYTSDGNVSMWGRNKTGNLMLGDIIATGDIASTYPNSIDHPWITKCRWPTVQFNTTCIFCLTNPGGLPCNEYTVPTITAQPAPTVNPGTNRTVQGVSFSLYGQHAAASGAQVNYIHWSQVSGPSTLNFIRRTEDTVVVTNAVPGVYVIQDSVTDNNWRTAKSTVTITVQGVNPPPTVNAGSNQTIYQPANSVTLSGTATGNAGATITSTSWSELSGPVTATFGSNTSLTTTAQGLTAIGSYVFQLSATDSNGQTGTNQVTITVNAAIPQTGQRNFFMKTTRTRIIPH